MSTFEAQRRVREPTASGQTPGTPLSMGEPSLGITVVFRSDDAYPEHLDRFLDAPHLLFV